MTNRPTILLIAPRFADAVHGERRAMRSAVTTATELSKHCRVVVVTAGSPVGREVVSDSLTIYRLWDLFLPDPINYGIIPTLIPELLRIMKWERPDAFLVNKHMFFSSLAAPFLRIMGKRVIVQTDTFPGINWFPRNPVVGIVMRLYAWTVGLLVLKSAHHVVLLHEGLVPVAKRLNLPHSVVHNGVDLDRFRTARPAADLPKNPGDVFVGYVGRLESVKGYDDLLAVAAVLAPKHPNVTFFLVGSTEERDEAVRRYAGPQIRFLGHRTDIPDILKAMDIFVLPSYAEGLPNALMEAMAAGCAPVASDVGGVCILLDDPAFATVPAGDHAALETALRALIGDSGARTARGQQARERIERDFDVARECRKLLELVVRP